MIAPFAFWLLFGCINVFAYGLMWFDKQRAVRGRSRVPERRLFLVALMLGATGIFLGTKKPLYHKAAKAAFRFGIPFLALLNFATLYGAWKFSLVRFI